MLIQSRHIFYYLDLILMMMDLDDFSDRSGYGGVGAGGRFGGVERRGAGRDMGGGRRRG